MDTVQLSDTHTGILRALRVNDASDSPAGFSSFQITNTSRQLGYPITVPMSQVSAALRDLTRDGLIRCARRRDPGSGRAKCREYRLTKRGHDLVQEMFPRRPDGR